MLTILLLLLFIPIACFNGSEAETDLYLDAPVETIANSGERVLTIYSKSGVEITTHFFSDQERTIKLAGPEVEIKVPYGSNLWFNDLDKPTPVGIINAQKGEITFEGNYEVSFDTPKGYVVIISHNAKLVQKERP